MRAAACQYGPVGGNGVPIVIDGGLSTALQQAGRELDHPLWTARLVADDPEAIIDAHLAYLRAGARVLVTSSYQASAAGFLASGHDEAAATALLARTTVLARTAIERFAAERPAAERPAGTVDRLFVAASVGPYGAVLADGSEYRGDYAIGHRALVAFHRDRLRVLVTSAPDLLAIETMPSAAEARAVAEALEPLATLSSWCSFGCRSGTQTWAGDAIEDAVVAALAIPGVKALGVNCTAPQHIDELLGRIAAVTSLPLVVYPNRGAGWDAATNSWRAAVTDPFTVEDVSRWVALGARFVGGCCGVGPDDVATLVRRLASERPER